LVYIDKKGGFMSNKIKEVRLEKGLTLQGLAERVGTSAPQIDRLERGLRRLTIDWLNRIAKSLDVTPGALLNSQFIEKEIEVVYKMGYVQAGKFNEACQLPEAEWEAIPYPVNDNYKKCHLFALGVLGDSMNLIFPPEKTTLICCPYAEWLEANSDQDIEGKYIIAYRKNADGLCEATVKKYTKIDENTIILVAESSNPEIKPIVIHPDNNEYDIAAVVIGDMRTY